jgi:hypothetical protein
MWRTDGKTDLDIMDFHQSKRMVVLTTTEKKNYAPEQTPCAHNKDKG